MKICVLNDPLWGSFDPTSYLQSYDWALRDIHKATAVKELQSMLREGFDLFFCLLDGAWDEARPGIEVIQALERMNIPFTGADSAFFEPTREAMKRACHFWGIQAPRGIFLSSTKDIGRSLSGLNYPLLIKHPNSYGSVGLTRNSRVETPIQLCEQVEIMLARFGGALVEEFIEGREFSVLVAENPRDVSDPIAYVPVEFIFPPGDSFKHEEMKWVRYAQMRCLPVTEPALVARLQDMSKKMFTSLNGCGFGRCDIRMNASGELFMLEINPNGAVMYPLNDPGTADLILINDPGGHKSFIENLIQAALARHARRQQKHTVRFDLLHGFGTYANSTILKGETIIPFEGLPHNLVSRKHVMNDWGDEKRARFFSHAYPMTDEIFVMWDRDPELWKPLNHSCSPNAWFKGLDVVARKDIRSGEQITLDYATFFADDMPAFNCHCGSANCRKIILGTDYLQPFVNRYGEHVSDYIRQKRVGRNSINTIMNMSEAEVS
jgi:D-alanine-D-alanine ligase-like ATP-grasp enzyme